MRGFAGSEMQRTRHDLTGNAECAALSSENPFVWPPVAKAGSSMRNEHAFILTLLITTPLQVVLKDLQQAFCLGWPTLSQAVERRHRCISFGLRGRRWRWHTGEIASCMHVETLQSGSWSCAPRPASACLARRASLLSWRLAHPSTTDTAQQSPQMLVIVRNMPSSLHARQD